MRPQDRGLHGPGWQNKQTFSNGPGWQNKDKFFNGPGHADKKKLNVPAGPIKTIKFANQPDITILKGSN